MRSIAALAGALAIAAIAAPAGAQESYSSYGGSQNLYIDGNTPIDNRTRDLVDAYVIHKEILDREEAERLQRLELFIYHDTIHSEYNSSLY